MSIFRNGRVMVGPHDFKMVREAILDCHVPVTKVIGFSVVSRNDSTGRTDVASRSTLLLENNIEVMRNLSKVTFLPQRGEVKKYFVSTRAPQMNMDLEYDPVYATDDLFATEGNSLKVLDQNVKLFTPQGPVILRLLLHNGTGQFTFEESLQKTIEVLKDNAKGSYIGVPVNFSLNDYIRILPPDMGIMRYRLYNGMTDEIMNQFWDARSEM